jgi:hypothetical protein
VNFDSGALHPLLVSDLTDVSINLVDGQAGPSLYVSAVLNLDGPLVASGKLDVLQGFGTVGRVSVIH